MGWDLQKGVTNIIMFTGNMNAMRLEEILRAGLLPFIEEYFPEGHRLYQHNDPKHTSERIEDF